MRKAISIFLLLLLAASVAQADTIHLKNGSVLKGKVASFGDDQFIVMLDTGSGQFKSRAMIYIGDVARIEFDSSAALLPEATTPPREVQPQDTTAQNTTPQNIAAQPINTGNTQPRDAQTTEPSSEPSRDATVSEPPRNLPEPQPTVTMAREPEPISVEKSSGSVPPATEASDSDRAPRKLTGPVRTATIDVAGKRDWTSTGLIIKRGDIIRITAAGTVTLDPGSGQTSGPEGINLPDPRKLMPDQPTGALIAVIGADNDEFIFIGRSAEFDAKRDGLLFLSVNEGALSDNTGSYKTTIEVQAQRASAR